MTSRDFLLDFGTLQNSYSFIQALTQPVQRIARQRKHSQSVSKKSDHVTSRTCLTQLCSEPVATDIGDNNSNEDSLDARQEEQQTFPFKSFEELDKISALKHSNYEQNRRATIGQLRLNIQGRTSSPVRISLEEGVGLDQILRQVIDAYGFQPEMLSAHAKQKIAKKLEKGLADKLLVLEKQYSSKEVVPPTRTTFNNRTPLKDFLKSSSPVPSRSSNNKTKDKQNVSSSGNIWQEALIIKQERKLKLRYTFRQLGQAVSNFCITHKLDQRQSKNILKAIGRGDKIIALES